MTLYICTTIPSQIVVTILGYRTKKFKPDNFHFPFTGPATSHNRSSFYTTEPARLCLPSVPSKTGLIYIKYNIIQYRDLKHLPISCTVSCVDFHSAFSVPWKSLRCTMWCLKMILSLLTHLLAFTVLEISHSP